MILNPSIADKLVSIIAIMQPSHHSFPKGWSPFVSVSVSNLYISFSQHRPRNDEDWQAAILARQKRFPSDVTTNGPIEGNRSDFAIRDPNRPYGQRMLWLYRKRTERSPFVPFGDCKIHPITYTPRAIASALVLDSTITLRGRILPIVSAVTSFGVYVKRTRARIGERKTKKACR